MKTTSDLLRANEASAYMGTSKDLIESQLISYSFFIVINRFNAGKFPCSDFDMLFFVETVKELCSNRYFLNNIVGVQSVWPDKDVRKIRLSRQLAAKYKELPQDLTTDIDFAALRSFIMARCGDKGTANLLRFQTAMEYIKPIKAAREPLKHHFFHYANYTVLNRFLEKRGNIVGNFDLLFYTEAMEQFFAEQDFIRRILAGEDFHWFSEGDPQPILHPQVA